MGKWSYIYFAGVFFEDALSVARGPLAYLAYAGDASQENLQSCLSTGVFLLLATALFLFAEKGSRRLSGLGR